jgi:hypothetical protein
MRLSAGLFGTGRFFCRGEGDKKEILLLKILKNTSFWVVFWEILWFLGKFFRAKGCVIEKICIFMVAKLQ